MLYRILTFSLLGLGILVSGCNGNGSTWPVPGSSIPYKTSIDAIGMFVVDPTKSPSTYSATVSLQVNNAAESTDVVVLSTPAGPVTLPYNSSVSQLGASGLIALYSASPVTYIPGGVYQFAVNSSPCSLTTYAGVTMPTGSTTIDSSGTTISWTGGSAYNWAAVTELGMSISETGEYFGVSFVSPFTIPNTAFPKTGGVTYLVTVDVVNAVVGPDYGTCSCDVESASLEIGRQNTFTVLK